MLASHRRAFELIAKARPRYILPQELFESDSLAGSRTSRISPEILEESPLENAKPLRALVETTMGRYKSIIGARLRSRSDAAQRTEVAIGAVVLNRMLAAARPNSVRRSVAPA